MFINLQYAPSIFYVPNYNMNQKSFTKNNNNQMIKIMSGAQLEYACKIL